MLIHAYIPQHKRGRVHLADTTVVPWKPLCGAFLSPRHAKFTSDDPPEHLRACKRCRRVARTG